MTTSSTTPERCDPVEINAGGWIRTVRFSADGEHLVSGGYEGIHLWRVEDGKEMATMKAHGVNCLAVSTDGKWIAAGTNVGDVYVWNAKTYEQVFFQHWDYKGILGVDFSPDATRIVAALENHTASVWDIATCGPVLLRHEGPVVAAKYSPQGDRIATATESSVRVYDSNDSRLLVDIKVTVSASFNNGLLWFNNNHLLVLSDNKIKQFDAFTGSVTSEWPIPSNKFACISLPKHGKFLAYSTIRTVTLWDVSTHTQLSLVRHSRDICSIAISPDHQFLATSGKDGKITIESQSRTNEKALKLSSLLRIAGSFPLSSLHPIFHEPDIQIDDAALDLWKQDQLTNADALLTAEIISSQSTLHHVFASRALVRARLREWETALVDAEKAIEIQPSVIAYIAQSIALVGKGEKYKGYQTCDIALVRFHSSHGTFLLLIKAIIVFMAGEHCDAISRVDDIIAMVTSNSICYVVQAYMYLLLGNSRMECGDYEGAIDAFEHARARMRHCGSQLLLTISLIFGWQFDNIDLTIWQCLCDALYAAGRTEDAVDRFHQTISEFGGENDLHGEQLEWASNFRHRSSEQMENLGDSAADARRHDVAISHYTMALSLDPPIPQNILIKRSKIYLETGLWQQALDDANQVIRLDPSSPWGYQLKHAALHKAGEYGDAVDAFEAMLSRMAGSPDPEVQQRSDQYISPSTTRATIRRIVQRTIRHSPRVLIDTTTGRLHNRAEQVTAFESLPVFKELESSMTTRIDYVRIKREVRQYFRYVMLSHRWEDNEPLFQQVVHIALYDLEKSPTHDKLQTFCKIVRDGGFNWAWSDTCCINKSDHFILQEALVAMFKWYQGSALVIVFLRGVRSSSQLGALVRSVWNARAWTLQEYVAAKVVHFYTEDWTLYLNLELSNHKESPEVISEMEQATGVSADQLASLRPGLTSIREKLRLASIRQTTLVEDAAYSLLGIFSVTGLPAIYGEGEGSLGRLLAHVLTGSGDVSILAWTGESGSFNSCLPTHITVFDGPATSHIPSPIPDAEMERFITAPHASTFDLDVALSLYDRLNQLPAPWFAASRMKLPCIAFQLSPLSPFRTRSGRLYRADTPAFGMVEIITRQDLSRMHSLYLVHPWLDALLEQEGMYSGTSVEDDAHNTDDAEIFDEEFDVDSSPLPEPELPFHIARQHLVPIDRETRARRFVARLRQPFGALLLTPIVSSRRGTDYKRVAVDSLITVQFQENVSLADILDNVRTLDVL
ncbi:hypothetical protein L210DRAFT_3540401 [Boletus edulis BED1]|uniref:Heterokaryon incompatibility domain-containing protein n=1 Tax=Boletus edulis BED1 TaxID=1328754 RepID=A0AAD4BTI3_BOLED|nr:hypothetical protein L210DRAFT_3540401 [Boletus edulis BED1]